MVRKLIIFKKEILHIPENILEKETDQDITTQYLISEIQKVGDIHPSMLDALLEECDGILNGNRKALNLQECSLYYLRVNRKGIEYSCGCKQYFDRHYRYEVCEQHRLCKQCKKIVFSDGITCFYVYVSADGIINVEMRKGHRCAESSSCLVKFSDHIFLERCGCVRIIINGRTNYVNVSDGCAMNNHHPRQSLPRNYGISKEDLKKFVEHKNTCSSIKNKVLAFLI